MCFCNFNCYLILFKGLLAMVFPLVQTGGCGEGIGSGTGLMSADVLNTLLFGGLQLVS